jgi:hypothetical protein
MRGSLIKNIYICIKLKYDRYSKSILNWIVLNCECTIHFQIETNMRPISKFLYLSLMIAVVSFLCSCEQWKSVGTVDPKKLIGFEELWKNRDNYRGKIITLQWGPEDWGGGTCPVPLIEDINYGAIFHVIDLEKDSTVSTDYYLAKRKPQMIKSALNKYDSIENNNYKVQIINVAIINGKIDKNYPLPSWVKYNGKLQPYSMDTDIELFNDNMNKSKQITAILISSYLETTAAGTKFPCFTVVPLGYRMKK